MNKFVLPILIMIRFDVVLFKIFFIVLYSFFALLPLKSVGQNFFYLQSYNIKDGLPSNVVYDVKQDSKGFIWCITDKGVVKYDGLKFKIYTTNDGLLSNDNFKFLIDSKDNIWLYSFKGVSNISANNKASIIYKGQPYFWSFLIDGKENIYFKQPVGIIKVNTNSNKIDTILIPDKTPLMTNVDFQKDNIYYSYKYHYNYGDFFKLFRLQDNSFIETPKSINLNVFPKSNAAVAQFIKINDSLDALIMSNGINLFKRNDLVFSFSWPRNAFKLSNNTVEVQKDYLLVPLNSGFVEVNFVNFKVKVYESLSLKDANGIVLDNEKNLWISTLRDGLKKLSNPKITVLHSNKKFYKISGYGNEIVYGITTENEICNVNSKKLILKDVKLHDVKMLTANEDIAIFGGGGGLYFHDVKVVNNIPVKDFSIYNDSIALATQDGIIFSKLSNLKNKSLLKIKDAYSIFNRMNAVYFEKNFFYSGNQSGLYFGNTNNFKLKKIDLDQIEESISVNGIKKSSDGLIWVSTEDNGIYLLKNQKVIRHFDKELLNSNIHSMKIDELDRVWVATRDGANLISKINGKFYVENITTFHGLPSNYVFDIYCFNDILYVATDGGLIKGQLSEIKDLHLNHFPKIYLLESAYVQGDKKIKLADDSIHQLKFNHNSLAFNYTGISYRSNGNIRFEYKLLPLVNNWIQTTNDNITFNQLKPGNYTFEVRAIDATGNVSEKPAVCRFVIQKHFTGTLWFRAIVVIFALWVVIFVVKKYVQYKRSKAEESNRVEKLISELRLKSLQAQLNPHFIFNSLNAIQQFINAENKKSANDYLSKFARLMRLYLNGSDEMFITLEQELEVLKLYCNLEHLRFADKFQYEIHIDSGLSLTQYQVPAMLLQPYVENAIRHGLIPSVKDTKLLTINVKSIEGGIVCIIEDTGIGRAKSMAMKKDRSFDHRSMGNKISKERLEMIRSLNLGNISEKITDIVDSSGQISGTNVQIIITKSKDDNP